FFRLYLVRTTMSVFAKVVFYISVKNSVSGNIIY
ncbi:MAG: hypothetical protein ACI8ZV_001303, partial [Chitinophagales bacterium]